MTLKIFHLQFGFVKSVSFKLKYIKPKQKRLVMAVRFYIDPNQVLQGLNFLNGSCDCGQLGKPLWFVTH